MMTKQKSSSLAERLNIGDEVRELKLGATFNPKNTSTAFHTIKYDFKPASVDTSRMATIDVGSNKEVTVTVPNLESSGVPHTVYKGNHREYTKECLIIYDKETGAITLEKLNHNIQVKKTRREMASKPNLPPAPATAPSSVAAALVPVPGPGGKLENSTMRITSKTKVSTGSRRNNIIDFKPRNSPMQQSSPSRPVASHRSPQSAPAWHANNNQQTLPSIPMIMDDDDFGLAAAMHNGTQAGSSTGSSSTGHRHQQIMQRLSPTLQQQNYGRGHYGQQQHAQQQGQRHSPPGGGQQQQQQQRIPIAHTHNSNSNSMPSGLDSPSQHEMEPLAAMIEQQIGVALSASSSSSDSDSSDSDSCSDSDDSTEDDRHMQPQQQQQPNQQAHMHQLPNLGMGSISPAYNNQHVHQQQQPQQRSGMYGSNELLQNDLQLSSNSSDDDAD